MKSTSTDSKSYKHLTNSYLWQRLRAQHKLSEPLCRICKAEGRITPVRVVDHIIPHRGNEKLFYDPNNWQSLCYPCHDSVKRMEERSGKIKPTIGLDGWPIESHVQPAIHLGELSHPAWFKPLSIPLTIVCGAPASGKTTYVATQRGENDIVFDLDVIAVSMFGRPASMLTSDQRLKCLSARNAAMGNLMGKPSPHTHAWLILAEPDARKRQWWQAMLDPAEIIVIETPAATCIARARADTKQRRSTQTYQAIRQWWETYTRRVGETVVGTS